MTVAGAAPELAAAEPSARFGGPDGLAVIRGVLAAASVTLRAGGWVAIEHAAGQQCEVAEFLERAMAFKSVTGHLDHAGVPRFVTARRRDDRGLTRYSIPTTTVNRSQDGTR